MLTTRTRIAVDTAIARGIRRLDAGPPFHRLLWAAGIDARPPHYASFGTNALMMGGFWGGCMAVFSVAWALHLHPDGGAEVVAKAVCVALLAALAFGLVMASIFRSRARQAGLPAWEDIPG